jgi:hypothetical protein
MNPLVLQKMDYFLTVKNTVDSSRKNLSLKQFISIVSNILIFISLKINIVIL